jgi:hypothetical protein
MTPCPTCVALRVRLAQRETDLALTAEIATRNRDEAHAVSDRLVATEALYNELLYAVAKKYPGESRHDTALRYIRDRETLPMTTGAIDDLKARLAEALIELNGVSPIETCARCGEQDRRHRMMIEEGDEWECVKCWERCNALDAARADGAGEALRERN